jgi:uncharacterized protein YhfF
MRHGSSVILGELANELTELVLSGKKTATASLYWEYEADRKRRRWKIATA